MNEVFVALVSTINQVVTLVLFYNLFLLPKRRAGYSYAAFIIFSFVCSLIHVYSESIPLLTTLLIIFAILYFFQGTKLLKVFVPALYLQVAIIADFGNALISMEIGEIGLFGTTDILIIVLLILNIQRRGKPRLIQQVGVKHLLLWLLTLTNFVGLALIYFSESLPDNLKIVFATLITLSTMLAYYFSFYLEKNYRIREENMLTTKQMEFQKDKLEQMSSYLQASRKIIHDTKKNYRAISSALDNDDTEQAKLCLKEAKENLTFPELLGFTGNDLVDSMLYSLYNMCQEEEIQLSHQLVIKQRIQIDEVLLASLLGNLFDRTISTVKQNKVKKIDLTIKTSAQFLLIELNYPEEKRLIDKLDIPSDEKLAVILQVVEKISGVYETDWSEGEHQIRVMLPLQNSLLAGGEN